MFKWESLFKFHFMFMCMFYNFTFYYLLPILINNFVYLYFGEWNKKKENIATLYVYLEVICSSEHKRDSLGTKWAQPCVIDTCSLNKWVEGY